MFLTTLSLTLSYLFIQSSQIEFRNWDFFIPCRNLHRKLWLKIWNSKIQYHRATLWAFQCMWWLMSLTTLSLTLHYYTFSFTPLRSSFGIDIFSFHVVTYIVSFDSRLETRKSDIIRPRYELFIACGGSCLSLCSLLHNITIPFHSLLSAWVSELRFFHFMSQALIQDLKLENPISYGHAMSFSMHVVDHVPHYLVFDTMLPFHSLLSARVSEFIFFHPMS